MENWRNAEEMERRREWSGMDKCQFLFAFSFEKSIIRDLETEA